MSDINAVTIEKIDGVGFLVKAHFVYRAKVTSLQDTNAEAIVKKGIDIDDAFHYAKNLLQEGSWCKMSNKKDDIKQSVINKGGVNSPPPKDVKRPPPPKGYGKELSVQVHLTHNPETGKRWKSMTEARKWVEKNV